ncbi:MAG: DUF2971 domain-containing protein [Acidobacteria bacterium]|nr:DUF2971 domain-containing protein [Acidobacteriota bacterium]
MSTLYKYRPYSARSLEMLIKREIYFASLEQLNDPYDCRLNVSDALSVAIAKASSAKNQALEEHLNRFRRMDHVYDKIQADIQGAGVFSLAKSPKNVLMWSHYADDHRGFAVGFQLSEKFTTHRNSEQIIGAADAYYAKANPFTDFFEKFALRATMSDWNEFWTSILEIGLRAKGDLWAYEDEVRILRKIPGPVGYAPTELTEIIFGLNMPYAQQITLRRILAGPDWKHVQFRKVVRSDGFAVDVVSADAT